MPDQFDDRPLLHRVAEAHGVQVSYQGHDGLHHTVADQTLVAVLAALDCPVDPADPESLHRALAERHLTFWRQVLPPTVITRAGTSSSVPVHVPHGTAVTVTAVLEDGSRWPLEQLEDFTEPVHVDGTLTGQATFRLPGELPLGWHTLEAVVGDDVRGRTDADPHLGALHRATLITTPDRITTADTFSSRRGWGLAVQLYSTRSSRSWGVGDLADLADLAAQTADLGGDYVLSNPLHASVPAPPVVASPYSPSTRRFVHPLYLRIEDIPELAHLDPSARTRVQDLAVHQRFAADRAGSLDRDSAYADKLVALRLIHEVPLSPARRSAYAAYRAAEGDGLADFSLWCALRTVFEPTHPIWSDPELVPGGNTAERYRHELADEIEFHTWLQWLCDQQLEAAQRTADTAGMRMGVMQDLAVGADRNNADGWMLQDLLVSTMSVGAPPDMYNQLGQDWSQSPWHPRRLAETGYRAYRDMLRTVLRHAGGIRVDHVLGLFRLWWLPVGGSPTEGAYVTYDHEAMIGVLALEAERAGAVVVGEDLGTFEPWVQDYLASRGLLGTSILWFEQRDGVPLPPAEYRHQCLAAVNTHDLPPTAGYLAGVHLVLRERLGLLSGSAEAERERAAREIGVYLQAAQQDGFLPSGTLEDLQLLAEQDPDEIVEALYRYLAQAPSMLQAVALVDAVGEVRIQNQPGTQQHQYPNWEVPLADRHGRPVLVDRLHEVPGFARLLSAVDDQLRQPFA